MSHLNSESEDQESSVEIIGRYVSEDPERKGTAKVWTPESESESSRTMGGGPEGTGGLGEDDGPGTAAGIVGAVPAGIGGKPKASLT